MDDVTVRDIGEFALIEVLRAALPGEVVANPALKIGIGDDAALWQTTLGELVVVTTDSLVEGVHFRTDWTDWLRLGHKTLAVNISDIAAMGGLPKLAVLTLGLRGTERVKDLESLYQGLGALAAQTGLVIAGGDIVASPTALTIHVTVLGETCGGRALTRGGARPGDIIGVSGFLGSSAAGLRLLSDATRDGKWYQSLYAGLIEAHLHPEPRLELGRLLVEQGATAAMDLSDGLFGDLPKILAESKVGARLDAAAIPVEPMVRELYPDHWLDLATRGGEDYELLFTAPAAVFEAIQTATGSTLPVTAIGEVIEYSDGEGALQVRGLAGETHPVRFGAFDHFG